MKRAFFKRSFAFVLLLTALLCAAAPATAYPKWINVTGKLSIVRNEKQKDKNANNYKQIKLVVTYKNNSKDKIITAIFNKTTNLNCKVFGKSTTLEYQGFNGYVERPIEIEVGSCSVKGVKSDKVNKCELYPGQSTSLNYYFNLTSFKDRKLFNTKKTYIKGKWSFGQDFQVRTEDI